MAKRAREAGGNLVIYGAKDKVKEVMAITNLDKVFDMFDNKKKAVHSFTTKK